MQSYRRAAFAGIIHGLLRAPRRSHVVCGRRVDQKAALIMQCNDSMPWTRLQCEAARPVILGLLVQHALENAVSLRALLQHA